MHQLSDSDPLVRGATLAKAASVVATLAQAVDSVLAKRRDSEFGAYVANMVAGGHQKIMSRREFDAHHEQEAERQARIEKYS
jgi:heme exporter protein D